MKKTKKLPKRLVTLLLALAAIVSSMGLTTAYAYIWEHPDDAKEVELYTDQDKTYCPSKQGPNMYFEGRNLSSTRKIDFQMQYFNGTKWANDKKLTVNENNILQKQLTNSTRSSDTYWRLALYPNSIFTGARGVGWMW